MIPSILTLVFVFSIWSFLGWKGIVGALAMGILMHIGYWCKHGIWWEV